MFFNSLGSLSPPMQWPSEIGYPKVRQSEGFWTITRMLIFLSIIFSIAIVIISTIQEEGSWTDIPGLPPSPAQVAPAFGDSGLLEVGAALPIEVGFSFFQFLILEIGEIIILFHAKGHNQNIQNELLINILHTSHHFHQGPRLIVVSHCNATSARGKPKRDE